MSHKELRGLHSITLCPEGPDSQLRLVSVFPVSIIIILM